VSCVVDLQVGEKAVLIRAAFGSFRFEVWEGGIDRELFDLLKSLECPELRGHSQRQWTVSTPMIAPSLPNEGAERRFIVFSAPDRGRLVLRCVEGGHPCPVSHHLMELVRQLDHRKEAPHEEDRRGQPAEAQGGAVAGPGTGDGTPAEPGLDGSARQAEARRLEALAAAVKARSEHRLTPNEEAYLAKIRASRGKSPQQHGNVGVRRKRGNRKRF